jgi:hypothetical protein
MKSQKTSQTQFLGCVLRHCPAFAQTAVATLLPKDSKQANTWQNFSAIEIRNKSLKTVT